MTTHAFMSSPLSDQLVEFIDQQMQIIRQNPVDKANKKMAVKIVDRLTEEAMNYYFFQPMDIIGAGPLTRKFVGIGVAGSRKLVNTMGHKAIASLDAEQMHELVDFIESLIHRKTGV